MALSAYCVNADVRLEFKNIDFTKTDAAVSSSTVDEWIAQASSEIDNRLSAKYQTPFTTGTNIADVGMSLIKQICIWLVSQRVTDTLESKTVRADVATAIKTDTATRARKMIQDIVDGNLPLIGALPATAPDGVDSYVSSHQGSVKRVFRRSGDQW